MALDKQDLAQLGKRAADLHLRGDIPLGEAVVKVAQATPNLTEHHVTRILENANLITFDEDDIADGVLDVEGALTKLGDLTERIRQREFRKRVSGKCSLELSKGTKIALNFFSTVMKAKKPGAKLIHGESGKQLAQ